MSRALAAPRVRRIGHVRFHDSGYVYAYVGVAPAVFRAFLEAPSKGRFLTWSIKGQYPYARVA